MASILRKIPVTNLHKYIFRSLTCKNKPDDFIFLRPTQEDYDCILELMHLSYYPAEPTASSIGFRPNTIFDDAAIQAVCEGYSMIVKCKYNGAILGACINETTNPWDPDLKDKLACLVSCSKTRQLLHFYAFMQRSPQLWTKHKVQKVFEMAHLFVRKDQRGKGLALKLMQKSRILAADCAFPVLRVDATSLYTAKICEKINMKLVHEIPYCSYVGADQKPIFNPPDPHKSVKIYIDIQPQANALCDEKCLKKKKKK